MEHPFFDLITGIGFRVIYGATKPSVFLAVLLFVSTGISCEAFSAPGPDAYLLQAQEDRRLRLVAYDAIWSVEQRMK